MKYLKEFESVTDANTQGAAGLDAPHVSIVKDKSAVNIYNANGASAFTCTFNDDGTLVPPTPTYTLGIWRTNLTFPDTPILETQYGGYYRSVYDSYSVEGNNLTVTFGGNTYNFKLLWKADNDRYLVSAGYNNSIGEVVMTIIVDTISIDKYVYYQIAPINLEINPDELTMVNIETQQLGFITKNMLLSMFRGYNPEVTSDNIIFYVPSNWKSLINQTFDMYVEKGALTQAQSDELKPSYNGESGEGQGYAAVSGLYMGGYVLCDGEKYALPSLMG